MSSNKVVLSRVDRAGMEQLAHVKGGALLRSGQKVFFAPDAQDNAYVYDATLLDFLLEWGNTSYVLTPEQQVVVAGAEMANDIPMRCELKNGVVYALCELSFIDHPPHPHFFEGREKWYYLNEVASMQLCPQYVPMRVMKELEEVVRFNKRLIERLKKIGGSHDPRGLMRWRRSTAMYWCGMPGACCTSLMICWGLILRTIRFRPPSLSWCIGPG